MRRTTLLVPVPEARALMDASLLEEGQPPHITLVFPFVDAAQLTLPVLDELDRRCGGVAAFDFRLEQVVPFGEVLFLVPDPAQPFRDLLRALTVQEPTTPYPVTVTDTIPHLTVAVSTDPAALEHIRGRRGGAPSGRFARR
jgi:2'-5' RNA ligase